MATTTTSTHKRTSRAKTHARATSQDALKLLTKDHAEVKKMFKQFDQCASKNDAKGKVQIANQICMELLIHTQVEEEIFYPAARAALDAGDLLNEAEVEHQSAKALIAQIQEMDPDDAMYDAKVTVLGEYIQHHVKEEEKEMFPKMQRSGCDLDELGDKIMARKQSLKQDFMKLNGDLSLSYLRSIALRAHTQH